jgi:hypothetical protein
MPHHIDQPGLNLVCKAVSSVMLLDLLIALISVHASSFYSVI